LFRPINLCNKHLIIRNVLLTVRHSSSVQWNQRDALSIQFIENWEPLHVSSITCSSSGGFAQLELGILRACYVSWLHPGAANWRNTHAVYQCRLCNTFWGWASNAWNVDCLEGKTYGAERNWHDNIKVDFNKKFFFFFVNCEG
jgi:hypothetical protein